MRRKRTNNKGITMVELIVSITILAIAVLPLLNSFVVATRTNVKAKKELRASQVATNAMEALENINISYVSSQFNYSEDGFNLFQLDDDSATYELIAKKDASGNVFYTPAVKSENLNAKAVKNGDSSTSSSIKNPDGTYTFVPSDAHKYYFYATNVEADGKHFNALITINARTEDTDTVYEAYNKKAISNMQSIDTRTGAISADTDTASDVITIIKNLYNINNLEEGSISRTITLDIEKDTYTKVTASYRYNFYDSSRGKYITFPEAGSIYEDDYTRVVYDNSSHSDDELEDVYLMYYPWYSSTDVFPMCTDTIIVNNDPLLAAKLHIVKQNIVDSNLLYNYEKDYKTAVYLNEKANDGKANMSIETNLGINLKDESEVKNQATYVYVYKGNTTNADQEAVRELISIGGLGSQEAFDRLFDVTVDIYARGTSISDIPSADKIVTLTGGMTSE